MSKAFQFIFSAVVPSVIPHHSPINAISEDIPSEAQISVVPLGRRKVEDTSGLCLGGSLPHIYLSYLPSNILHDFFGMPEQSFQWSRKTTLGENVNTTLPLIGWWLAAHKYPWQDDRNRSSIFTRSPGPTCTVVGTHLLSSVILSTCYYLTAEAFVMWFFF